MTKKTTEKTASIEIPNRTPKWMSNLSENAQEKIHNWQVNSAGRVVNRISENPEDMERLAVTFPETLVFAPVHKAVLEILERIMAELEELKEKFRQKSLKLRAANKRIKKLKTEKEDFQVQLNAEKELSAYLLSELGMTPDELLKELADIKNTADAERIDVEQELDEKLEKLRGLESVLKAARNK